MEVFFFFFLINSDFGIFREITCFLYHKVKDILLVENSLLEDDFKAIPP